MRQRQNQAGGVPLQAASCLMLGYTERDESYTGNIWDEERAEIGWGEGLEEGSFLFPKDLSGWMFAM